MSTKITDRHARPMEGYADQWVPRHISEELERKLGEADKARRVLEDAADHLNARLREEKEKRGEATNVMRSATILIAAKGRHNTMLAYNGLREALARIDSPDTSITTTNPHHEKHEKVLAILAEVLDDWRAGLSPSETPSYRRGVALLQENPKP